jgi:hypothetical protein
MVRQPPTHYTHTLLVFYRHTIEVIATINHHTPLKPRLNDVDRPHRDRALPATLSAAENREPISVVKGIFNYI